jgi:hypothetical protein
MSTWADEHIKFGSVQERKEASKKKWPRKYNAVTLLIDGKVFPIRSFNKIKAASLYLPEVLVKKDYMCYKHKPPLCSMLLQV